MSYREPHAATEPRTGEVMGMRGCVTAATCESHRPGHGLHAMQERLALATPSRWVDAIVADVDDEGYATLIRFDGGDPHRVWHHDAFDGALRPGEPVALHAVYGVLALGGGRWSVADA
ncbi:hypothetical protein [Agromyces sp. Marseille-P2726]|uniref:hypothetical protein n=1 Tax=Agromyces sp. Marseille-P2726 TaxID=2709132 RepID=UPI00156F3B60|nr:hypothetical protein [Agromyces sp. Marseille-P2726]